MKTFFLIVNSNASKGKGRKKYGQIVSLIEKKGHHAVVGQTKGPGHAVLLAKKAVDNGFKTIVAVGGDGTVNEVANGILLSGKSKGVRMGIIPIGRGNDFAWVAGIPSKLKDACALVIDGKTRQIDVGYVKADDSEEGRYFVNGVGFGFEPMVNFKASEYKHLNGMPSYIAAFLHIFKNPPKPYELTMIVDDEVPCALSTQQVSVANGIRMGSAFKMTPLAKINDAKLDVMYTKKPLKGIDLLKAVMKFFSGKHVSDKESFEYLNVKKIELEAKEKVVQAHIDGEILTKSGKKFSLEVIPDAIGLISEKSEVEKKKKK